MTPPPSRRPGFGPRFAASRPSADPAAGVREAWGEWLDLAGGDDRDLADPGAIIARRELPDGRLWGTTSVTLVALAPDAIRYDFQASPGSETGGIRCLFPNRAHLCELW